MLVEMKLPLWAKLLITFFIPVIACGFLWLLVNVKEFAMVVAIIAVGILVFGGLYLFLFTDTFTYHDGCW